MTNSSASISTSHPPHILALEFKIQLKHKARSFWACLLVHSWTCWPNCTQEWLMTPENSNKSLNVMIVSSELDYGWGRGNRSILRPKSSVLSPFLRYLPPWIKKQTNKQIKLPLSSNRQKEREGIKKGRFCPQLHYSKKSRILEAAVTRVEWNTQQERGGVGTWNVGAWSQESPTPGQGTDWKVGSKGS